MERVGCVADQPVTGSQTGSLRVTTQLIIRDERWDRLSVARILTASNVTSPKSGAPSR